MAKTEPAKGQMKEFLRALHDEVHPKMIMGCAAVPLKHGDRSIYLLKLVTQGVVECYILKNEDIPPEAGTTPDRFNKCYVIRIGGPSDLASAIAYSNGGSALCRNCRRHVSGDEAVYGKTARNPLSSLDHYCRVCATILGVTPYVYT